jgi:hypothetical protein
MFARRSGRAGYGQALRREPRGLSASLAARQKASMPRLKFVSALRLPCSAHPCPTQCLPCRSAGCELGWPAGPADLSCSLPQLSCCSPGPSGAPPHARTRRSTAPPWRRRTATFTARTGHDGVSPAARTAPAAGCQTQRALRTRRTSRDCTPTRVRDVEEAAAQAQTPRRLRQPV